MVSENSQLARAYKLYTILSRSGKQPFLLTGYGVNLPEAKYAFSSMQNYQKIFKTNFNVIQKETYDLFYSLAETEVCPSTTLRKLTDYQGVSLWDICAQYIFSELIPFLYYINITENILDLERPQKVHLIDKEGILENVFSSFCKKRFIELYRGKKNNCNLTSFLTIKLRYFLDFTRRIKRFLISLFFFAVNFVVSYRLRKTYKAIFFVPLERFFNSMLPIIQKYDRNDRLVIYNHILGSAERIKENKIPFTYFYGYKLYNIFNIKINKFLVKMKKVIYQSNFLAQIYYKKIPLGNYLSNFFIRLIQEKFPEAIREIDIIRKVIFSYKPDVIVIADSSSNIISLIAKSLSKSVVSLQCSHPEEFIYFAPVIADAVTVDGPFWKEYLSGHNVPEDKIWVTGPLKFDLLPNDNSFRRALSKSKKTVVFSTAYSSLAMGVIEFEKIEKLACVCRAIKKMENVYLVIKLHPFDNDLVIYEKIVKDTGLSDYTMIKNVDMLSLLKDCDLLITYYSVVGYEAVLMNKNVIWLCTDTDFRCDDGWDFRQYGAVLIVDNLQGLESSIYKALFDQKTQSELKKNRLAYIEDHAYKLDGNSSERVKRVIDRFITVE